VAKRIREAIARSAKPAVEIRELHGETSELLDNWRGWDSVVVIDAMVSGEPPGTVRRLSAHEAPLQSDTLQHSTHGFGLYEAVELARALGELPARFVLFTVEAKSFEEGAGLTPEAEHGAGLAMKQIIEEIDNA